ncbi:hypothetical protein, partial [Finegoldia magna]
DLVIEAFASGTGLVIVDLLLGADFALRRKGDVGYFDDDGLEHLKNIYLQSLREMADRDPDTFLGDEDHASYLIDMNRYSEGGDEGRRWIETHVTSPTRFLQFARGRVSVSTSQSGATTTRTEYISPSSLEYLLGLARCAEWVDRLDSIELNETESQTLAMVR